MTSLSYRFFWFVFRLAIVFIAFQLFVHPWLVQQMNGTLSQLPPQYSGLLTAPGRAIQQLMSQLPTTSTSATLP